ncbi:MAG: hypothetical protein AAGN66_01990 [Acidobacteriota bacterium]
MVSYPIKSLLTGLVDYAGLFPPARLDMAAAVEEYARCRRGEEAWILGRFVVPASRLDELATLLRERRPGDPWPLSALVAGDPEAARSQIDTFNSAYEGLARVESVEAKPADAADIVRIAHAFDRVEVFYELPWDREPEPMMEVVAANGTRELARAKIRSGGITEDAFPSIAQVARFVVAAGRAGVAFKATAGLHHPLRGEYRLTYETASPSGTMHGFLNLFLAAAWVKDAGLSEHEVKELLAERRPGALDFSAAGVAWREHKLTAEAIALARRTFAISYGSCSFQEPVDDLRHLHLI